MNYLKIHRRRSLFILVAMFIVIGLVTLLLSRAATPVISLQPELSTVTLPAKIIDDPNVASGDKAIQFSNAPFVIAAAGDVGQPTNRSRQAATASIVRAINPTYLLALGDLAYPNGTAQDFADNYTPYWGVPEILNYTKPIPGNHEYNTSGAIGYYNYFDASNTGKFGARDKGYYSFTKDNWLFLQINSECAKITGGCANGGAQANWVDQQLSSNPRKCIVASWHKPRVTMGQHSDAIEMNDIWNKIVARDGIVLSGHNHLYTRTKPLGVNAVPTSGGITQFLVGTGGASFYTAVYSDTVREAKKIESELGVLKLTLQGNDYAYQFISTNNTVLDQGSDSLNCK